MLILHGVTISLQNLGTILGVFLQGNEQKIQERYFSFWNFGATSGELEEWSDNCKLIWIYSDTYFTANDKLFIAMQRGALAEILNRSHTKGLNPFPLSCEIAEARIAKMEWVTWYQTSKTEEQFDLGDSIHAEKDTGNFDDDVVGKTLHRHRISTPKLDKQTLAKAIYSDGEQEEQKEED